MGTKWAVSIKTQLGWPFELTVCHLSVHVCVKASMTHVKLIKKTCQLHVHAHPLDHSPVMRITTTRFSCLSGCCFHFTVFESPHGSKTYLMHWLPPQWSDPPMSRGDKFYSRLNVLPASITNTQFFFPHSFESDLDAPKRYSLGGEIILRSKNEKKNIKGS